MKNTESKIILCLGCGGTGKIEQSELEDYHNNISNYWDEECPSCDGFGRLIEETMVEVKKLKEKDLKLRSK